MSKVVPVQGKIIVERNDKAKKGKDVGPFSTIVSSNNLGVVKYSSDENNYPVGTSVYYGGNHETLLIEGSEVLAMSVDNIIAKVVE